MASFFAELPGEGNPLNEANLLHALTTASSGRPQQVKAGTAQLQEWERRENYFTMLQVCYDWRQTVLLKQTQVIVLSDGNLTLQ